MSTLFFPVVPFLLQLVVIAFFTVVAMFLASSGEPKYVLPSDTGDGNCPKEIGTPRLKACINSQSTNVYVSEYQRPRILT